MLTRYMAQDDMLTSGISEEDIEAGQEKRMNELDDNGSNGMSDRELRIMVYGYDDDDWRACAARDYEREAIRSCGGRLEF